eukprot:1158260-Pelagomonas_calceolata.AAC.3
MHALAQAECDAWVETMIQLDEEEREHLTAMALELVGLGLAGSPRTRAHFFVALFQFVGLLVKFLRPLSLQGALPCYRDTPSPWTLRFLWMQATCSLA